MRNLLRRLARAFHRPPSRGARLACRPSVERLEARDVPSAYTVQLPDGGGSFVLSRDADARLVLRQGDTELFAAERAAVSALEVVGTAAAEAILIDLASAAPD